MIRHRPMKRGGRIKAKPRTASETERVYGPRGRVEFVQSLPCANCGMGNRGESVAIANAHIKNGGRGRKADYTAIIPLCEMWNRAGCHNVQHALGWSYLSNLDTREKREAAAAATEAAWQAHQLSLS